MNESLNTKYIAIKIKGFDYYLWFEQSKVIEGLGCFIGKEGWGHHGAFTNIKVELSEIAGFVYSDELQYT